MSCLFRTYAIMALYRLHFFITCALICNFSKHRQVFCPPLSAQFSSPSSPSLILVVAQGWRAVCTLLINPQLALGRRGRFMRFLIAFLKKVNATD